MAKQPTQPNREEQLQWVVLLSAVIAIGAVLFYQQILIDDLTRRITRSIESNDAAIGAIERKLIDLTMEETATAPQPTAEAAPRNVDIRGTRGRLTIPGSWTTSLEEDVLTVAGDNGLIVALGAADIGGDDLQAWFAGVRSGYEPPRSRVRVGPNQILVGGKLAIDETLTLTDGSLRRLVFVRDGGTVVTLVASAPAETAEAALAAWDAALQTFAFAGE